MSEKESDPALDVITDEEQEHAQNALNEYREKNFVGALQFLEKLESRTNDFKVAHNKALLEFCKSEYKKIETFQKNLTAICSQFKISVDKLDDVDQSILHYNQAILLYHQRKYTDAIYIMDRVYKFIEPMEEELARKVGLFALELQLCIRQSDKALTLINYLENNIVNTPVTPNSKEKEKKRTQRTEPGIEEFKKKLKMYKIRTLLLNHDLEEAKKEISSLSDEEQDAPVSVLNANLEYLNGNLLESQKLLCSVPNEHVKYSESGESSTVLFYNNMGVIHHVMGKPNLACHYFQMALKEDMAVSNNVDEEGKTEAPLHTLGGTKYHEIIYNLGVSLLYAKKPAQAFDCLIIAIRRYHRNPTLWLRLAECCIYTNKESNEIDFDFPKKQREIVADVVGSKAQQKVILTRGLSKDRKYSTEGQTYAVPVPSLEFASLCLRNAVNLLPSDSETSPLPLFVIPGVTPPVPPCTSSPAPSAPLTPENVTTLRNSILVASAYVSLCLGDYIIALEHAEKVLMQPKLPGAYKLLGHMYAAEALVLLDKISEALQHLNPDNIKDIKLGIAEEKLKAAPPSSWFPHNLATARATMQYNIAVCKTIRGQMDEAINLLTKVWQMSGKCKVPGHIVMLVLYIELKLGRSEQARTLIKQYLFQNKTS